MKDLVKRIKKWREPGPRGERVAARFLRRSGYRILGRNIRLVAGELDIVAEAPDRRTLVVVEVKSSEMTRVGPEAEQLRPEARVGAAKQRKLVSLASILVNRFRLSDRPVRFDVIGVDLPKRAKPVVRHHVGAFESHL